MDTKILDQNSLAETLSGLEEVRLGLASASTSEIEVALGWLLSRQGQPGSYREGRPASFYAPTAADLKAMHLPTGERQTSAAAIRHILGEETLRALVLWDKRAQPQTKAGIAALSAILDVHETGMGVPMTPPRQSGRFCCSSCTPAFLRAVSAVKPEGWEKTLHQGVANIRQARTPDGRWHRFKFYYTLLMLSEAETENARSELRYVRPLAEKIMKRYQDKADRASRFRAHALEAALAA